MNLNNLKKKTMKIEYEEDESGEDEAEDLEHLLKMQEQIQRRIKKVTQKMNNQASDKNSVSRSKGANDKVRRASEISQVGQYQQENE